MKIALVGGSGFIGTRLTQRLLAAGHEIHIIDKVCSHFYPDLCVLADVRDQQALSAALQGCEVVINLAAEHKDNVNPVTLYDEVNVNGAKNICLAAENSNIKRVVFTSSVAVYGFAPLDTDENGTFAPFNHYGRTKMLAEGVYREWLGADTERSLTIVRPTVVFGEQNRGNVYNLLRQIVSSRFIMIGNGNNEKSMAYVENMAAFLEYSLSFGPGEWLFNYTDKPDFSMNDLVILVKKLLGRTPSVGPRFPRWLGLLAGSGFDILSMVTGKTFPVSAIRVKKFCSNTRFRSTRLEATTFVRPFSLREGLERTVRFEFLENGNDTDSKKEITFESE